MRYYRNPSADKNKVIELLQQLLANTYLLYIQTQGAHWNITGNDFPQLHTLFQTQYTELQLAVDIIAEHIRTYGAPAPGSAFDFIKLATFKEATFISDLAYEGNVGSEFLLQTLVDQHNATIEVATHLGEITANAIHTQNLAADRIDAHEKAVWMLSTTLQGSPVRRNPYWRY